EVGVRLERGGETHRADATTGAASARRSVAETAGDGRGGVREREDRAQPGVERVEPEVQRGQTRVRHAAGARGRPARRTGEGLQRDLDVAVAHGEPLARMLRGAPRAILQAVQFADDVVVVGTVQLRTPSHGPTARARCYGKGLSNLKSPFL